MSLYKKNSPSVRFKVMITCIEEFMIVFRNRIHVIYKVYKNASVHFVMFRHQLPNLREAKV
jgi:hypothetical protein